MIRPVDPAERDHGLGYSSSSEHLADWASLTGLAVERLAALRRAMPHRAQVTAADRRALVRASPELASYDQRMADARAALAARTTYARRLGVELPLELVRERFGLTPLDLQLFAMLTTIERGAALNPYLSGADKSDAVQSDVAFLVALVADGVEYTPEEVRLRFTGDAPLVAGGLIELASGPGWVPEAPLAYKRLRVAERVLDFVDGLRAPGDAVLGTLARFVATPLSAAELIIPDRTIIDEVARALVRPDHLLEVIGAPGVGRKAVIGAAARALGSPVLIVDMREVPVEVKALTDALAPMIREARLQRGVLILEGVDHYGDGEGQGFILPHVIALLRATAVPLAVVCERSVEWLGRCGRVILKFLVPFPSAETQRKLWVRHLPAQLRLAPGTDLETIVKRYSASCAAIGDAAVELGRLDYVHQRGGVIAEEHVVEVIRSRLAHRLGALATVVRTTLEWPDVILPDEVLAPVFEFLNYAAHSIQVFKDWGFDRKLPYGRGLSALFAGPPGTGKTMICSILAKELGLELYRIDLSQVVNKYIGETEKNLGRVFDEAARGQVMLLFDEADSLFSKRTEVKSSHDRYANLEVNYLLQRLESHDGVVVMTTNSETAIDPAFRRRIRFRVRFPAPDEHQRTQLWLGMMPKEAQLADDVDFAALAKRFPLAGGNIMNALVRAATAAAAEGSPIRNHHLTRAAEYEYAEMGFLA
ncbi:MAG: ATP-binding protein [Myxococcales bacterium]|nr:ATP-binding protein [Myxococcales bacterium]